MGLVLLALVAGTPLCLAMGWWVWAGLRSPDLVARVLFCETASCTRHERLLVAGVMKNRIGHPAFGYATSLHEVVGQPGAFSCGGDEANGNWARTRNPAKLTMAEQAIWRECLALAHGDIPAALGPSGRPLTFYHDKSITKPKSWDTETWRVVHEHSTTHFVFYRVVPAGK